MLIELKFQQEINEKRQEPLGKAVLSIPNAPSKAESENATNAESPSISLPPIAVTSMRHSSTSTAEVVSMGGTESLDVVQEGSDVLTQSKGSGAVVASGNTQKEGRKGQKKLKGASNNVATRRSSRKVTT